MKYKPDDKVKYLRINKTGTIVCCVNEKDKVEIRKQGHRYYVDIGKTRWSISEDSLKLVKKDL